MGIFSHILRCILGLVFLFSGLIKLNDPVGTSIKLEEYFSVFAADGLTFFAWFTPFSVPLALVLVVSEVLLGLALCLRYRLRGSLWMSFWLLSFFTFLTFYSAFFEKVTDCGCFGDAIKLTPWVSFTKDALLLTITGFLVLAGSGAKARSAGKWKAVCMGNALFLAVFAGFYVLYFLPFIDFRPYKVGANIARLREPAEPLRYGYVFIKDEVRTVKKSYIKSSNEEFVTTELLNPEALPKIKDYAFWNGTQNVTNKTLKGKKLLILIQKTKTFTDNFEEFLGNLLPKLPKKVEVWSITSVTQSEYKALQARSAVLAQIPHYYADATLLKAMLRAENGLVLLQEGVVRGKWSRHAEPSLKKIRASLE